MPKSALEKFLICLLTEHSVFQFGDEFFRSCEGLCMGNKLSSLIANIYVDSIERKVIDKYIEKGIVKKYVRYADDSLIVVRKRNFQKIIQEFNGFDSNLQWTYEEQIDGKFKFLDTTVVYKNNIISLEHHQKDSLKVALDYKLAIAPKEQKWSVLCNEVHRARNSTTTDQAFNTALEHVRKKFSANNFPPKLIEEKINTLKTRNFEKSPYRLEQAEKRKKLDKNDQFTLTIPYVSPRCSKVASDIKKTIKKFIPSFEFNVAFSLIRLDSAVAPFRKPIVDKLDQANLVYKFTCDCSALYVGETSQILYQRILQHRTHSDSTIYDHIQTCPQYLNALRDNVKKKNPTNDEKRKFFVNHFQILERNLIYATDRKCAEAIHINLKKPILNRQVKHRRCVFFCVCPSQT